MLLSPIPLTLSENHRWQKILKKNRAQKYLLPYIEPEDESNRKTDMKTTE